MAVRDQIMEVLEGNLPDRIPWSIYSKMLPRGSLERKVRNKGCALIMIEPAYIEERPHVRVEEKERWKNGRKVIKRTYITPVGSVSEEKTEETEYYKSHAWFTERVIKKLSDYDIVRFIVEDTLYHPNHEHLLKVKEFLGDDGIVLARVDYPPLEKLIIELMGIEKFSLDLYDYPSQVEGLLRCIEDKQSQMYQIAAEAPVQIVRCASNISSELTPPSWFKKYLLPFYNRQAALLHKKGKFYMAHMDGKLKSLLDLISETDLDIIEAFTPPPMGDLSLSEARKVWKNKIIWANFPSSLCWEGEDKIRKYLRQLLQEVAPGNNFILGFTEDIPRKIWGQTLKAFASAMHDFGSCPIR